LNYDAPTVVWPYYSNVNTSVANHEDSSTLGKDDFLKILIVQLQNQDPMQPMEDKEFIAQMAQFSTVEQIQTMGEEMALLRQSMGVSSDLIGKHVGWSDWSQAGGVEHHQGVVESILFSEGKLHVQIGEQFIPLDEIFQVWTPETHPPSDENPAEDPGDAD